MTGSVLDALHNTIPFNPPITCRREGVISTWLRLGNWGLESSSLSELDLNPGWPTPLIRFFLLSHVGWRPFSCGRRGNWVSGMRSREEKIPPISPLIYSKPSLLLYPLRNGRRRRIGGPAGFSFENAWWWGEVSKWKLLGAREELQTVEPMSSVLDGKGGNNTYYVVGTFTYSIFI